MANADSKLRGRTSRCCRGAESRHLLMPLLLLLVAVAVDASGDDQNGVTQEVTPTVSQHVAASESQSVTDAESTFSSLAPSESNSSNVVRDGTNESLSVTTDRAEHDSETTEKHDPDTSTANSVDSSVQANTGIADAPSDSSESTLSAVTVESQTETTQQILQDFLPTGVHDPHSSIAESTVPSLAASESMSSAVTKDSQAEGTQRTLDSRHEPETIPPTVVEDPDTSTTTVADFREKVEAGSTVASIALSESVSSAAGEDSQESMTEQTLRESSPTAMVPFDADLVTSDLTTMLEHKEVTTLELSAVPTSNAAMPESPMDSVSGSHEATTGRSETAEPPVGSTDLSEDEIQTGDSATTTPSVSVTPIILDDVMQTPLTIETNASTLNDNVIDTVDRTSTMTDDPSKTATTSLTVTGVETNPDQRKDLPSEVKEEIVITRIFVAKDIDINDVRNNFTTYLKIHLKTIDDADKKKRDRRQATPSSEAQADINVQYTATREVARSEANWELEYYATREGKIIPADFLISASKQAAKEYAVSTGGKVLSYYGTERKKWTPDPRTSPDREEFHDNSGYVKAILGIIGALVGLVSIAVVAVWLVNRRRTKSFNFTKSIVDAESGYKLSGVENPVMANEIMVESSRAEELSSKPALSTNGHASLDKVDDEAMIIPLDQLQAEVKI